MFSKFKIREMMNKFDAMDVADIADRKLQAKAKRLKKKQGGFTLLELLVVVAILAAIAGTATLALQDTDARASAAAHVTMMDEINKGIRTFRVLNKNQYPDNFDSMLEIAGGAHTLAAPFAAPAAAAAAASFPINELVAHEDVGLVSLTAEVVTLMNDIGMNSLQYLNNGAAYDHDGDLVTTDCESAEITATIADRGNAVVANNIFMSPTSNGCGTPVTLAATDNVLVWTGGYERVMGAAGVEFDSDGAAETVPVAGGGAGTVLTASTDGTPVLMVVGVGPSSTLFNANDLGGMTTVPVYRHVSELQYGRFAALFEIGTFDGVGAGTYLPSEQVNLVAIVDGAGDTKEEELGEWDGTRNTI